MELKEAYAVVKFKIGFYSDIVAVFESKKDAKDILGELQLQESLKPDGGIGVKYEIQETKYKPKDIW